MSESAPPTQQEYWNSKVGDEWARQADRMDRMLRPLTLPALELLALQPGERVLDIGCGAGATTLAAARQVAPDGHIVGVDLSRQLLAVAREREAASGVQADFIEADAGAAPIPGAPFDAAFSRFGVMFFTDTNAAFANVRQSTRPGGRMVFVCWRPFRENLWTHAALTALTPMLKAPVPPPDPDAPGPFALQDRAKINAVLAASGWRDVAVAPWDGDLVIGEDARDAADFLLRIGPCARAIAEQDLDPEAARALLCDFLAKYQTTEGVPLAAACWIVRAVA